MTVLTRRIHHIEKFIPSEHVPISMIMRALNELLKEELVELEEEVERLVKSHKSIHIAKSHFTRYVGKRIYGLHFKHVERAYERFLLGLTDNRYVERRLRGLLQAMIEEKLTFDVHSGKTNLDDLSENLVYLVDIWFKETVESMGKCKGEELESFVKEVYEGRWEEFFDGLTFYFLIIITAGVFLRKLREGVTIMDRHHSLVALATKIYYGDSFSMDQFRDLQKAEITGSIIFRGLALRPKQAYELLRSARISRGDSWSSHLDVAIRYGAQQIPHKLIYDILSNPKKYAVKSARSLFKTVSRHADRLDSDPFYVLIDSPKVGARSLHWLLAGKKQADKYLREFIPYIPESHSQEFSLTMRDNQATVCVILSYLVLKEQTFVNVGEGAVEHFMKEGLLSNQEVILNVPEGIKLESCNVDVVFPVSWKLNDMKFIPSAKLRDVIGVIKDVSPRAVDEINKSQITEEKLRQIMLKYDVPKSFFGKIFGLLR